MSAELPMGVATIYSAPCGWFCPAAACVAAARAEDKDALTMGFLPSTPQRTRTTKQDRDAAEDAAWRIAQGHGLRLIARNYRTPGRGGGEIDLIVQTPDGTTVFVEVRSRAERPPRWRGRQRGFCQATPHRVRSAALPDASAPPSPPCRFDVVVVEPEGVALAASRVRCPSRCGLKPAGYHLLHGLCSNNAFTNTSSTART